LLFLLLALLVPLAVAALWGDVYAEDAYQGYQKARVIARGNTDAWEATSPLYTLSLALVFRILSPILDDAILGFVPAAAMALSVLGSMLTIAAWFSIGMALQRPAFSAATTVLLASTPIQTQVLGLESGLVFGLFGLATLLAVRGRTTAMLVILVVMVATQPVTFALAVPVLVFGRIWRRSSPTLFHMAILVIIGSACYILAYALVNAWPGIGSSYREPRFLAPLLMSAQILVAVGFSFAVPNFEWLARPLADRRALQRGVVFLGLVALAVWQGAMMLDSWRLRPDDRLVLYRTTAEWLREHTLPTETVGSAQAGLLGYLADRPALALPDTTQPSVLLAAIDRMRPDYCVTQNSLVWHGVRSQPWFQGRYRPAFQLVSSYDSGAPLTTFRYSHSPFDAGETVTATARFTPDTEEWIELTGFRLDSQRLTSAEPIHLTLVWRAATAIHRPLFLVVRLIDAVTGKVWAQTENLTPGGFATQFWNADMEFADRYSLVPPADLPPGDYVLDVAFYQRDDDTLPILAGDAGGVLRREPIIVTQTFRPPTVSTHPLTPDHSMQLTIGNGIELVGYDAPDRSAPGNTLRVALYWRALQSIPTDYKVFVHLLAPDDQLLAQDDAVPAGWTYPTTRWQTGEYIRDEHVLTIDRSAARGDYVLSIGLYDSATGERAVMRDAAGNEIPEGRLVLQQVQVR
jgi:hypothetical protein